MTGPRKDTELEMGRGSSEKKWRSNERDRKTKKNNCSESKK